jgi:hypothetical protein
VPALHAAHQQHASNLRVWRVSLLPPQVRVRLQQQDTLRDLALSSTARLLEYTSASVAWDAAVRSTAVVDLGSPHAGSRRSAPLLAAEMTVSPDGLSLGYGTGPEAVHSRLMALFDNGLQRLQVGCAAAVCLPLLLSTAVMAPPDGPTACCCHGKRPPVCPRIKRQTPHSCRSALPQGLPDLEPQLMEHLFWPEPRKLTSLHPQEPEAVAARAALEEALARGLLPMRDYLNCWKRWALMAVGGLSLRVCWQLHDTVTGRQQGQPRHRRLPPWRLCSGSPADRPATFPPTQPSSYEPLLALSVEAEVERLAARGAELTLGEVQASVARAVADLREMEAALPATLNLGLVQVNCVKVGRVEACVRACACERSDACACMC